MVAAEHGFVRHSRKRSRNCHGHIPVPGAVPTLIAHGPERRITLHLQNFRVLASIVATTDRVAFVPHSVGSQLSQHNDVKQPLLPMAIPAFDV